jgi:hypothetical protein
VLTVVSTISRKPVAHWNGDAIVARCPSSWRSRPAASQPVQPLPEVARRSIGDCRPPSGVRGAFGCSRRQSCACAIAPTCAGVAKDLAVVKGIEYKVLFALSSSLGIVRGTAGRFSGFAGAFLLKRLGARSLPCLGRVRAWAALHNWIAGACGWAVWCGPRLRNGFFFSSYFSSAFVK